MTPQISDVLLPSRVGEGGCRRGGGGASKEVGGDFKKGAECGDRERRVLVLSGRLIFDGVCGNDRS